MTDDLKLLWDSLKTEGSSTALDPDRINRIDVVMKPVYALLKAFENERAHHPFTSKASCPICGTGTVTYNYRALLIGNMKCDTPNCIRLYL